MRTYHMTKMEKNERRNASIMFIVDGGSSWAIQKTHLTPEWVERIESMLVELSEDKECEKAVRSDE